MTTTIKKTFASKHWDYFILICRVLLAWQFLSFGYAKFFDDGQFGISGEELNKPIKDLSLFKVMWYLFDHNPFKIIIGICQTLCGALLLYNKTVIIGALLFLPIAFNILIMDITFMEPSMVNGFASRLSYYILLDLLILYHYKDRMLIVFKAITGNINNRFSHSYGMYLISPILAVLLSLLPLVPVVLFYLVVEPDQMLHALGNAWHGVTKLTQHFLK
ncbi:putative membrane protein YphA (DoxX/SURF4 family) [Chryseobacterium rhizosphaerae]|uniref:hypothetical protein n=1 Tax=Chryseobacterium rhizosphaerae TaxID=395937 RepID=UPI002866B889|nr:hypothetical protein [Chryseobacterium rhizosphaerae]MDR6545326.1 putative membrane protein YphA (DoxX/SURF4 family) [Chryseobacterium rhizosphaerae]